MPSRFACFWVSLFAGVLLTATGGACGGSVTVAGSGGSGGGSGGCAGFPAIGACVYGCGSDAFDSSICQDGVWVCPPGTVPVGDCPAGTCSGPPLPCEVCNNGWSCAPNNACVGSCESLLCATCNGAPAGTLQIGACTCACDSTGGQYGCALAPGCCNKDIDCGDETFVPCVNNVCKPPVMGACWSDTECGANMKCSGAVVCPCSFDCNTPDMPGTCVPS